MEETEEPYGEPSRFSSEASLTCQAEVKILGHVIGGEKTWSSAQESVTVSIVKISQDPVQVQPSQDGDPNLYFS